MKKIILSIVAVAALAACTKSEVAYDTPEEIGFVPVAKLNTKAAVAGTDYPDALNMYIFANAGLGSTYDEVYFKNAEFEHKTSDDANVFSGVTPYYWPNVKKLIFSGYSKSGNVASLPQTPTYNGSAITIKGYEPTIKGYEPGAGTADAGSNDLMWFPTTAPVGRGDKAAGQELVDGNVDVTMKHACAWVTIILKGDAVTAGTTPWNVEGLKVLNLSQTADVALGTAATWSNLSTGAELVLLNLNTGAKKYEGRPLTATAKGEDYTNNDFGAKVHDLVVIPQDVKGLEVSYNFVSQKISDSEKIVIDETLPISLTPTNAPTTWDAGKHYTYTITLTAQQILVEPTVENWVVGGEPEIQY